MHDNYISQQTLAERWGINARTLERWRSQGIGPAFLKIGCRILYRQHDINAYEQRCLRNSGAETMNAQTQEGCAV